MRNDIKKVDSSSTNRVFSYLRWSSDRQTWGDSERRQNDLAEQWCARNGLTLAGQEKDEGVSAFTGKNRREGTGLSRLLKTVTSGDLILVEDTDRWSREKPLDSLNALRDTVNRGINIHFLRTGVTVTKENFNNPEILFPSFFGSFLANQESAKKSVRVKASWEARKAAMIKDGKPMNQNLPSWLRWNWETKQVVQIPERVEIVQRMFKLYLNSGSVKKVTRQLVSEGIPSISKRKSAGWSNSFVHHTLTNRSVLGDSFHTNPPTPNIFPKIVSEEDFYAVAARLKKAKHFTASIRKADANLFTGLAVCNKCGRPTNRMTFKRKAGSGHNTHSYLICGAALHDTTKCGYSGMRYDIFENSVLGLLCQDETVITALSGETVQSPLETLKGRLADVQKQAEKILRLIECDDDPPRSLLAKLKVIEAQESALQAEIDSETAKAKAVCPPVQAYKSLRSAMPVPTMTIDRAKVKRLLPDILEKIVVKLGQDEFTMHFKGGQTHRVKLLAKSVKG